MDHDCCKGARREARWWLMTVDVIWVLFEAEHPNLLHLIISLSVSKWQTSSAIWRNKIKMSHWCFCTQSVAHISTWTSWLKFCSVQTLKDFFSCTFSPAWCYPTNLCQEISDLFATSVSSSQYLKLKVQLVMAAGEFETLVQTSQEELKKKKI